MLGSGIHFRTRGAVSAGDIRVLGVFDGLVVSSEFGIILLSLDCNSLIPPFFKVVIPPWPMYNKHPIKWLPVAKAEKKA